MIAASPLQSCTTNKVAEKVLTSVFFLAFQAVENPQNYLLHAVEDLSNFLFIRAILRPIRVLRAYEPIRQLVWRSIDRNRLISAFQPSDCPFGIPARKDGSVGIMHLVDMKKSQSIDVQDESIFNNKNNNQERRDSANIVEVNWFHRKLLNKIVQVRVGCSDRYARCKGLSIIRVMKP